ncbi:MAG: hypothetical protein V7641_4478 [Blastocatellia bacterium]
MTCYLCNQPIDAQSQVNWHHYDTLKSEGARKSPRPISDATLNITPLMVNSNSGAS